MVLKGYIFGFGLGVSVAVSFFYLYFLRIPGLLFTIIWSIVLSIEALLAVGTILLDQLVRKWQADGTHTDTEIKVVQAFEIIGIICCILYLCLILVLRKRIMLALAIVKEAGKALTAMPILIFLPVVQCIAVTMFLVPWFIYMIYLASSGEVTVFRLIFLFVL
jgi:choline transporter-like protein 2/4/5